MFYHMDDLMQALAKMNTQLKENLYFAGTGVRQKMPQFVAEVTPTTSLLLISAQILDPFRKFQSFQKWDKAMYITPVHETLYSVQYQKTILKYVEN